MLSALVNIVDCRKAEGRTGSSRGDELSWEGGGGGTRFPVAPSEAAVRGGTDYAADHLRRDVPTFDGNVLNWSGF